MPGELKIICNGDPETKATLEGIDETVLIFIG
jgi:hypothetical protein